MSAFLERYVHGPLAALLEGVPEVLLPLSIRMDENDIEIGVGGESFKIAREGENVGETDGGNTNLPDDVDDEAPGP